MQTTGHLNTILFVYCSFGELGATHSVATAAEAEGKLGLATKFSRQDALRFEFIWDEVKKAHLIKDIASQKYLEINPNHAYKMCVFIILLEVHIGTGY
jgi:hypothetical protein